MHEIAIVNNLFEIIIEVSQKEKLSKISKVNFLLGEIQQIVPEIFRFAFESAAENTIAQDAILNIEIVPIKAQCNNCKEIFHVKDFFYCPKCQSNNLNLINGNELTIKSIEGE
ncbi:MULTISPECIES: hydrogenase maturation nickel metallochaperone HypA [unclassified Saccharicrinis]|uniref:hydrogenase maturation nickel metallochaperone HypA n=1 Tax=unclassified Saccharicrinis TaxID=2646859 RepID=UPI003D3316CA